MNSRIQQYSAYRLVAALGVLAFATIAVVLQGSAHGWQSLFGAATFSLVSLVATLAWARRAEVGATFAYVQLAVDAVVTSIVVGVTGGAASIATVLYAATIAGGAYLAGRTGAIVATVFSIAGFGAVVLLSPTDVVIDPAASRITGPLSTVFGLVLLAVLTPTLFARARAEERATSEKVLESLHSGVLTIGRDGIITTMNPAALLLLGEAVGKEVREVLPGWSTDLPWEEQPEGDRRFFCSATPLPGGGSVVVVDDVTELMRMRERAARDERFVVVGQIAARVAHEIRNPLASVSGALQVVKVKASPRLVDLAISECDRLNRLVDEILDTTRPMLSRREPVDMRALVDAVVESFTQDGRYRNKVQPTSDGEHVIAAVDPDRMRQVVWNLLLNGAQSMPRGGTVAVAVSRTTPEPSRTAGVVVSVRDEGTGIDPAEIDRLFDPFHTRRTGGLGLGLMVVDQIVRAHGGTIEVIPGADSGTEFRIWLPLELAIAI